MIKRKYVLKLTRRSFTLLILTMLVGAIWMFVLGIFVGRNTVPVSASIKDIKTELASLKNEDKQEPEATAHVKDADKKKRLGFYEDLKIIKNVEPTETKRPKRREDTQVTADTDGKAKSRVEDKKKKFTIQVASVKDERTADTMVAELKHHGYPAYKTHVDIPELGQWFRVRVGHYGSKHEADAAIEGLKRKKFKPILLQETEK